MCLDLCPQSALKPPCILGLVCFDLFGYNWEKTMFLKWFWKKAVYKICLFVLQKEWQSIILDESYQILFKSIILNQIGNKISFLKYYFCPSFGALCRLCKVWKSEWASSNAARNPPLHCSAAPSILPKYGGAYAPQKAKIAKKVHKLPLGVNVINFEFNGFHAWSPSDTKKL